MLRLRRLLGTIFLISMGFLIACPAYGQNSVRWTTNFYSVKGATIPELQRSIRENRPWKERFHYDAMTDWRVNWQFTLTPSASGCRVSTFGTQTTIVITMPRWNAPTNAPEATRQIWQKYVSALGQHEAGHGAMAIAAASEMTKKAHAIGEGSDCDGLKAKLDAECRAMIDAYRAKDKLYDETTRHGATQGAALPGGRLRRGPNR